MSALRPFVVYDARGYVGAGFTLADAEQLAPRAGRAVVIDVRSGARFVRRPGGWVPDGLDLVTLRRLRKTSPTPHPDQAA